MPNDSRVNGEKVVAQRTSTDYQYKYFIVLMVLGTIGCTRTVLIYSVL